MSARENRRSRRSGLGREARLAKRKAASGPAAVWPGLAGGKYQPLSDSDLQKIHHAALAILERTGVKDPTPELLEELLPKGATVNEHGRLRKKMDPDNAIAPIETLRGRGYRFALERNQAD